MNPQLYEESLTHFWLFVAFIVISGIASAAILAIYFHLDRKKVMKEQQRYAQRLYSGKDGP